MLKVSAAHVSPLFALDTHFAVIAAGDEFSAYRVGGDAKHGYYAMAPQYGCGRTCKTLSGAIRDLLMSNGCTSIRIEVVTDEGNILLSDSDA